MAKVYVLLADVVMQLAPGEHWIDRELVGPACSLYAAKRLAWEYEGLQETSEADASAMHYFAIHETEYGQTTLGALQTFNPKDASKHTIVNFDQFRDMWHWWDGAPVQKSHNLDSNQGPDDHLPPTTVTRSTS